MTIDALIFDFDGLIIDSEQAAFQAWNEIYGRYGVKLPLEEWVECVGASYSRFDPVEKLAQLTGMAFDGVALMAEKNARKDVLCHALGMLPGVAPLIYAATVKSMPLAVASSSGRDWVIPHLRRLDIYGVFHSITTREDVARVKPHPDLYLKASERLKVTPERCLVFEDSVNGVRAAKAAGMRVVAVPGVITRGLNFDEADQRISSLLEFDLEKF